LPNHLPSQLGITLQERKNVFYVGLFSALRGLLVSVNVEKAVGGRDGQTLLNTEAGRVSRPYPRPKSLGMAEAPWAECHTVLMPHHITDEGKLFRQGPFFLTFCMSL